MDIGNRFGLGRKSHKGKVGSYHCYTRVPLQTPDTFQLLSLRQTVTVVPRVLFFSYVFWMWSVGTGVTTSGVTLLDRTTLLLRRSATEERGGRPEASKSRNIQIPVRSIQILEDWSSGTFLPDSGLLVTEKRGTSDVKDHKLCLLQVLHDA